ncbi:MAG: hypothetical protein QM697_00940 [Lachnospiraceae bacterium]
MIKCKYIENILTLYRWINKEEMEMSCTLFHKWKEWEEISGKCEKIRRCKNCDAEQTKEIKHTWGNWYYLEENKCIQRRICERCGQESEHREQHDFVNEWRYILSDSCTKINPCKRCTKMKVKYDCHEWGEVIPEKYSCESYTYCLRCGEKKKESVKHNWRMDTYNRCLDIGASILKSYVEKEEKIMELSSGDGKGIDGNVLHTIDQISRMKMEMGLYDELKQKNEDLLGKVCMKCGRVVNLGICQQDKENLIEGE